MTSNHKHKITVPNDPKPFAWLRWLTLAGVILWSTIYVMGCNYINLSSGVGHPGEVVTITGTISLDPGVTIAGIQTELSAVSPLSIVTCTNLNSGAFSANKVVNPRLARIASMNTENPWTTSTDVFSCLIKISPNSPKGHFPITVARSGLSDKLGMSVSYFITNGEVYVY
jgi:hypothetical protein